MSLQCLKAKLPLLEFVEKNNGGAFMDTFTFLEVCLGWEETHFIHLQLFYISLYIYLYW
jgi:hypothetical protein